MNKEILKLSDCDIEKREFHYSKYPIYIKCLDIDNIIISNKVSFGKKAMNILFVSKMIMRELKLDSHLPKKFLFICFGESPLKMMKNAFYFISFRSHDI